MPEEKMTLTERLLNPQWVHGPDLNSSAVLDKEQTLADMKEAAAFYQRAADMRNAIDMIESAMMGLGNFVEFPRIFEDVPDHLEISPKMEVGQMRRVCHALEECTRIINSPEYNL